MCAVPVSKAGGSPRSSRLLIRPSVIEVPFVAQCPTHGRIVVALPHMRDISRSGASGPASAVKLIPANPPMRPLVSSNMAGTPAASCESPCAAYCQADWREVTEHLFGVFVRIKISQSAFPLFEENPSIGLGRCRYPIRQQVLATCDFRYQCGIELAVRSRIKNLNRISTRSGNDGKQPTSTGQ